MAENGNSMSLKAGRLMLNGVEVTHVQDVRIHAQPNQPAEVEMIIQVASLDASLVG